MSRLEKSKISIKLEALLPDPLGGPNRKFCIDRTMRAKWSDRREETLQHLLDEIKNYKGSFLGDMFDSLVSVVDGEVQLNTPKQQREHDVTRWAACMFESIIVDGIQNKEHESLFEQLELPEWDGTTKKIEAITPEELNSIDVDRLVTLLAPKLKHYLYIISKELNKNNER